MPNTENPITCLNIVIIKAATLRVKNNHIRFIGNQFAISVSVIYDNINAREVF